MDHRTVLLTQVAEGYYTFIQALIFRFWIYT
jgi:hypothetical protein